MFVGREEELAQLDAAFALNGSATLLFGKRRVGKTTLIKQALLRQSKVCIYYECLKGTIQENVDAFTQVLYELRVLTISLAFHSFQDIFAYLNTLPRQFIIVIDEYPSLKTMASGEAVDSAFQFMIDNRLANINLVLSGSHIGMMKEMMSEGNALYGRFGTVIRLRELNYQTASAFYPSKTSYEKIAFHSVFGGSPFVLEQLRNNETLEENIVRTILNEHNPVHIYASHLLLSDYSNSIQAERIFYVLGNGKKKYSELEGKLNPNKTGNLAKQLKALTEMEIISRMAPMNKPADSKKARYEINDNLMRFYFTFVYRHQSALQMLGPKAFYAQYVAPALSDFIARRFEEICRDFFSLLARNGKLPGIRNIGSYYYDDPLTRTNGEFDVALDYGSKVALFEAKYYLHPMTPDEIHREAGQIRQIRELNIAAIGFIAANGFAEREAGYIYYTADDLYHLENISQLSAHAGS